MSSQVPTPAQHPQGNVAPVAKMQLRANLATAEEIKRLPNEAKLHCTWAVILVHTAKCDDCNQHNTNRLFRCEKCGQQSCQKCVDKYLSGELKLAEYIPPHCWPRQQVKAVRGYGLGNALAVLVNAVCRMARGPKDRRSGTVGRIITNEQLDPEATEEELSPTLTRRGKNKKRSRSAMTGTEDDEKDIAPAPTRLKLNLATDGRTHIETQGNGSGQAVIDTPIIIESDPHASGEASLAVEVDENRPPSPKFQTRYATDHEGLAALQYAVNVVENARVETESQSPPETQSRAGTQARESTIDDHNIPVVFESPGPGGLLASSESPGMGGVPATIGTPRTGRFNIGSGARSTSLQLPPLRQHLSSLASTASTAPDTFAASQAGNLEHPSRYPGDPRAAGSERLVRSPHPTIPWPDIQSILQQGTVVGGEHRINLHRLMTAQGANVNEVGNELPFFNETRIEADRRSLFGSHDRRLVPDGFQMLNRGSNDLRLPAELHVVALYRRIGYCPRTYRDIWALNLTTEERISTEEANILRADTIERARSRNITPHFGHFQSPRSG